MDHMTHSSNLHWTSYGTTPDTSTNVGPSQTTHSRPVTRWTNNSSSRGSKRAISESDCDDVYSEESSKDPCTSPGDSSSCYQMLSRKKRRGVIEKKRRDRINTSLTELKRLVPTAYEKQGSAKLEKAEILQMTVDHLKMLHAKGLDNLAYDPHKFAMDYHIIGFRECASEVARYLVTIEGMDIQDPLRLRLMSHLQCFVTQRELASKQAHATSPGTTSTWNYPPPPTNHHPSPGAALASNPSVGAQHYPGAPAPPVANPVNLLHHHSSPSTAIHHHSTQGIHPPNDPNLPHHYGDYLSAGVPRQPSAIGSSYTTSTLTPLTSTAIATTSPSSSASTLGYHHTPQYHNLNSYPTSTPSSISNYNQNNTQSNMKPYRPWGAEVAY